MNNMSTDIKNKRLELGLTIKELADAVGLPKDGDKLLRDWENGNSTPTPEQYSAIIEFATNVPILLNLKEPSLSISISLLE